MKHYFDFRKKRKWSYLIAASAVSLSLVFAVPIFGAANYKGGGYYQLTLNDTYVGSVSTPEAADEMIREARQEITAQEDLVVVKVDYQITKQNKIFAKVDEEDIVKEAIIGVLNDSIIETKKKVYTLKTEEYSVILQSKEEVIKLLEASKEKYDTNDEFEVVLVKDESSEENALMAQVVKAETLNQEVENENQTIAMSFEERIEIVETYALEENITPVEQAISEVTKEKEVNQIYEVKEGDSLSKIAEKYNMSINQLLAMNAAFSEESILHIGDELVVMIPEPELSIVVQKEVSYQAEYQVDTQYVENNSWYTTRKETVQQGESGIREVTALVTYQNGMETNRDIKQDIIVKEAKATIIEQGTITPPSYIKPLSGGTFTSRFGMRQGRMHKGVDWAVPVGTSIKASSAGTVVSAGWVNGYGYCITISHSDGKKTRYGHLSEILVSVGQSVGQGQQIAFSGNTGRSTGPHLHFEIIVNGSQVNPLNYLN